jgi:hypothetical protein
MASSMLSSNFKFKYFFGFLNPHRRSHTPPTSSLVFFNVLESNNIGEQKTFPHAPELQSISLEIFVVDPNALLETIVINVDDECVPLSKKPK